MLVRAFAPDDFSAVTGVVGASANRAIRLSGHDMPVRRFLNQPRFNQLCDLFVAFGNGDCTGFAAVKAQVDIGSSMISLFLTVDDGDIAQGLVDACRQRAKAHKTKILRLPVSAACGAAIAQLESLGFERVRTYHLMRLQNRNVGMDAPDGFGIVAPTINDIGLIFDLQNSAFTGHFEYSVNSLDEMKYVLGDLSDPRHSIMLLIDKAHDNMAVGYVQLGHGHRDTSQGWIEMVGVLPRFRGRRFGRYLMSVGIEWLQNKLGVDFKNVWLEVDGGNQHALRMYASLGFQVVAEHDTIWLELTL